MSILVLEPGIADDIGEESTKWELASLEGPARDGHLMAYRNYSISQCMDTLRDKAPLENAWNDSRPPWRI
jgi:glucose-1-phosphate cytidylyltransferase